MNTYNISFVTNSEQLVPFTKLIKASTKGEAKRELMSEAQIPKRFILFCEKV